MARSQDELYAEAAAGYAPALERLARAYEADADKRRDLLQEIHFSLWRSFAIFDARCSLGTWVYRVAHNTAMSYVVRQRRIYTKLVDLEDVDDVAAQPERQERENAEVLLALIRTLKPLDRQIIVSYLEGLDSAATGEITGLSPANVAMKVHRIKALLARRFQATGKSHVK